MKFAIIGNLEKPGLRDAVGKLVAQLNRHRVGYVVDRHIAAMMAGVEAAIAPEHVAQGEVWTSDVDVLVAFGGDGTILAAAREVGARGTPILGVNLGKLGFLAEITPEEMARAVHDIVDGNVRIERRIVLEASATGAPGKLFHAVNDIVVDKSRSSRVIDMETHIDGAYAVTYRGDGLIVATPTGSTAYALSNGGPIVTPGASVLGITPISPHTLSGRPLVLPDTSVVKIIVHSESDEILVSADGQMEALLRPPVEVTVRKAEYCVCLVKRTDRTYFDVLRAKLHWGRNPRSR